MCGRVHELWTALVAIVSHYMLVAHEPAGMGERTTVAYVARSAVRADVLRALASEPQTARTLVATLSISRSGAYKALRELAECDLVAQPDGEEWQVTGPGRLVADELERHGWVDALLGDREYWLSHDLSGLPGRFRRQLPSLRNAELLRNPANYPRYLEGYWLERMPEAERLWVGSRVVHEPYADAMAEQADADVETRLVVHGPLLEQFLEREGIDHATFSENIPDTVEARVCDLPCSFMLTEDLFTLSLPDHEGEYDPDSVLVGRDDAALRFGEDFATFYWERATSVEAYLTG
ncbi:MAG: transcriptional regulator FilR1 domain-containing protein [Haloarculaceae archaeon]